MIALKLSSSRKKVRNEEMTSSEDVYLEPALLLHGDALERRLECILEESWAEFEAEQQLASPTGAARLNYAGTGYDQHQHQHQQVAQDRQFSPLD